MEVDTPHSFTAVIAVAAASGIIGIGKLLQSSEKITFRLAVGRAIVTSALGVGAFTVLAWIPDLGITTIFGIACLFASLGESAVEGLLNKYLQGKK